MSAPKAVLAFQEQATQQDSLYVGCEISWGSRWVDLNDHINFIVGADNTRDGFSKTYRKITTTSPVLSGNYLVHAVPDMVSEQLEVWVHGEDQTNLADNVSYLQQLFEQWSYRIRWTFNEYREYWNCQLADFNISQNQVWTHSYMAQLTMIIPRFAEISSETLG